MCVCVCVRMCMSVCTCVGGSVERGTLYYVKRIWNIIIQHHKQKRRVGGALKRQNIQQIKCGNHMNKRLLHACLDSSVVKFCDEYKSPLDKTIK